MSPDPTRSPGQQEVGAALRAVSAPMWSTTTPEVSRTIVHTLRADPSASIEVFVLQGSRMRTREALMDEFATVMQFFDGFGRNYHALPECLEWIDETYPGRAGYLLVVEDADQVLADQDDDLPWLVIGLDEAWRFLTAPVEDNEAFTRGPLAFHVLLVAEAFHDVLAARWREAGRRWDLPAPEPLTATMPIQTGPAGPPASGLSEPMDSPTQHDWLFSPTPPRLHAGPPEPGADSFLVQAFYSRVGLESLPVTLRRGPCRTLSDLGRRLAAALQLADPAPTTLAALEQALGGLATHWPGRRAVIVVVPDADELLIDEPESLSGLLAVLDGVRFATANPADAGPALHVLLHTQTPAGLQRLRDAASSVQVVLGDEA